MCVGITPNTKFFSEGQGLQDYGIPSRHQIDVPRTNRLAQH